MIRIGFTGTRKGMTETQFKALRLILVSQFSPLSEFHFGDCVGADAEGAAIAKAIGYVLHSHPPDKSILRAFVEADMVYSPKAPLDRNRDIASICQLLIATPAQNVEVIRSGTWATVRYARAMRKRVIVLEREKVL